MSAPSTPRAVLLKGPTLNSKVFMTALPERHEDLVAKACDLFCVPADHTPQLYVSCQASVGPASSEQRGALLLADAMPFLRDREMITVRWAPTDVPRRDKDGRVQWDPKLDDVRAGLTPVPRVPGPPLWRGPQARAMHVARVLERERANYSDDTVRKPVLASPSSPMPSVASSDPTTAASTPTPPTTDDVSSVYTKPAAMPPSESPFHEPLLSPPPSSPTESPSSAARPTPTEALDMPMSPTPQRKMAPLEWPGDSDDDASPRLRLARDTKPTTSDEVPPSTVTDPDDEGAMDDTATSSRKGGFGAWCARLNPFARGEEEMAQRTASPPRSTSPRTRKATEDDNDAAKTPATDTPTSSPWTAQGAVAYDIMTQVLVAVREHPKNVHFTKPHEFRWPQQDGSTLGVCVSKRTFDSEAPLAVFAEALHAFFDTKPVSVTGTMRAHEREAAMLLKFAETLMGELQRTSAPPPPPAPEPKVAAPATSTRGKRGAAAVQRAETEAPVAKRTRRSSRRATGRRS